MRSTAPLTPEQLIVRMIADEMRLWAALKTLLEVAAVVLVALDIVRWRFDGFGVIAVLCCVVAVVCARMHDVAKNRLFRFRLTTAGARVTARTRTPDYPLEREEMNDVTIEDAS